ncbi:hypothetical protein C0991_012182, partial [Blastosporella zonata]
NCPAFVKRTKDLEIRFPENAMPYFPVLDDDLTWVAAPPRPPTNALSSHSRIENIETALTLTADAPTPPAIFTQTPADRAHCTQECPPQTPLQPNGTANRQASLLNFNFTAPRNGGSQRDRRRADSPPTPTHE